MADLPEEDAPPGVPEWVVTYGDMMSLLLTFFIMLVSMSELKKDGGQLRAAMDALNQRFGATDGTFGVLGSSFQTNSILNELASKGVRAEGGVERSSRNSKGRTGANHTVKRISHGTIVTLGGPTFFQRFQAEPTPELKESLDRIVESLADKPNRLVVRGHATAEPLPPESKFRDPMDLAFARARFVAHYLVQQGISREKLLVCSAGDAEPRVLTRDPEGQAKNRRVDVFLIDSYITRPQSQDARQ